MDATNTENSIAEKIKKEIEFKQDLSDEDVERIIISEITSAKYLKEDWQIHYAKERIKKIITERRLEKLSREQRVNFGHPGWYFFVCVFIGNLTRYTKNHLLFIASSVIGVLSIYFLSLWVAKLFYKNKNEQKRFLVVKKISLLVTITVCLMMLFTFAIIFISAKREAIKETGKDGIVSTSTVMIIPVKIEGSNNIVYPSITGLGNKDIQDSFNNGAKKIVDDEIASFNTLNTEFKNKNNTSAPNNSLQINYQIIGQNSNYISIKFIGYLYSGGAHGSNINISYNFNLKNGQVIKLADLFKPDNNYIKTLSDYAINELKSRNISDLKQIEVGASPKIENFKTVNISDNGLLLTFGDYQVAGYATGPQTVSVPFKKLESILNY